MSRKRPREDAAPAIAVYEAWLRERGATWHKHVRTTDVGVVAGVGCVAAGPLKRGQELCRVPKSCCLGAEGPVDQEPPPVDSQRRLARLVLEHEAAPGGFGPLLAMCTPAPCPWLWPEAAQRLLGGTELGPVLQMKRARLAQEARDEGCDAAKYAKACALVVSHLNPWFGGSIVPFNVTLNASAAPPNVEFLAEGQDVVGRPTRTIQKGEELTQAYTEGGDADLVYRCGFALGGLEDTVSLGLPLLAEACGVAASPAAVELLAKSGLVAESPWDGVFDLTLEIEPQAKGTARLLAACWALLEQASLGPVEAAEDEDETAGRLCAHLGKAAPGPLVELALANGGDEDDPWPALLQCCPAPQAAQRAAKKALGLRRQQIEAGAAPGAAIAPGAAGLADREGPGVTALKAIARQLQRAERRVLADAARGLKAPA